MNEALVQTLLKLFALVTAKSHSNPDDLQKPLMALLDGLDLDDIQAIQLVQDYRRQALALIKDCTSLTQSGADTSPFLREKLSAISSQANREFEQHQKVWLILQVIEFAGTLPDVGRESIEFIRKVAGMLRMSEFEFNNSMSFILGDQHSMPLNENLLIVAHDNPYPTASIKFLANPKMDGVLFVLHIDSINTLLIKYFGQGDLYLNGRNLVVARPYVFATGGVIRSNRIDPIYYNKVVGIFTHGIEDHSITYVAKDISYRFAGSKDGVHPFSFHTRSGELIAIMGGSGVGKSTLLNLLSGQLKLRTGQITINGYDVVNEKDNLEGVIGYVPQDDLLIDELTVFDNLKFNAMLCFRNYTEEQIKVEVDKVIEQFDLVEARNLKVGNPLNKFISGGQRKRLNIAMELMRQPAVLFVDEPTSGLSSIDSEKVMLLLKRQALSGKIVVVNIHQPSSDLYKLFDRVLIVDHGGRVIFQGNPMDAIVYFKQAANFINPEDSECSACGNVNTDLILKVVEARVVNEYGKLTRKRKRTAEEWYRSYMLKINPRIWSTHPPKTNLPENNFKIPERIRQLGIFIQRNVKAKLANRQYMLITLLEAPILAFILGFFSKYIAGTPENPYAYSFIDNSNIPSYLFMCVVAVLFFGLSASAQEIIKDRKILQREKFLNLSRNSYLLSKVLVLCLISALQTLAFLLIANFILEVNGLTFEYFVILFSISVCANMIGLNISSALNSEVAIYILIPLILVPQMLFSGVVVQFDKLHQKWSSTNEVPWIGEVTVARWAYEALAVTQFKKNRYENYFFDYNMQLSQLSFTTGFYLPQIEKALAIIEQDLKQGIDDGYTESRFMLINNELPNILSYAKEYNVEFPTRDSLSTTLFTLSYGSSLKGALQNLKQAIIEKNKTVAAAKNEAVAKLTKQKGSEKAMLTFKHTYYNDALADLLLDQSNFDKIIEVNERLYQLKDPIYHAPEHCYGRAHFYAPYKQIGSLKIDTMWFNIFVIWITIGGLYVFLYFDWLRWLVQQVEKNHLRRISKRMLRIVPR